MEHEKLITPSELADILGLRRSAVYRMLRLGRIPAVRVTESTDRLRLRVRPKDLEKWLKSRSLGSGRG